VAYLIASRIKANIREIEGSLTRILAFGALSGREMTLDLAHEVLSDLRAKNRTKTIAFPRQIAMYLARQLTHASLAEIGRAFGGKDHTTVLHAVEKVQSLLQEDPKLKRTIDTLTQGLTL
ncbi:MAG TPA: helix-turn-helix domain-containing protein, partial [Candidatus Eisenbacteria bacterium]|nr:helix-turn-helix domain-containing protein [Candidatus Eisenbacteria bacterium]